IHLVYLLSILPDILAKNHSQGINKPSEPDTAHEYHVCQKERCKQCRNGYRVKRGQSKRGEIDKKQRRKRPFSDVQTAPARRRWVGVAAHRGGFSRSAPLAAGDKGNTMNVSESLLTYRTEVKEVTLVAGRWSQTWLFLIKHS